MQAQWEEVMLVRIAGFGAAVVFATAATIATSLAAGHDVPGTAGSPNCHGQTAAWANEVADLFNGVAALGNPARSSAYRRRNSRRPSTNSAPSEGRQPWGLSGAPASSPLSRCVTVPGSMMARYTRLPRLGDCCTAVFHSKVSPGAFIDLPDG